MSKMYGKRRVVLDQTGIQSGIVSICGSDEASSIRPGLKAGNYHPLGLWYKEDGLFYVDLTFTKDTIANKRLGGLPTKQALRAYVMEYWDKGGAL